MQCYIVSHTLRGQISRHAPDYAILIPATANKLLQLPGPLASALAGAWDQSSDDLELEEHGHDELTFAALDIPRYD